MYNDAGGRLNWMSEHHPRWKDWRGRALYKHRYAARHRASDAR